MAQTKEFMREVEAHLMRMYSTMGIDKPENHEDILDYVVNDVLETADPDNWHSGDVAIGFRRWIEHQEKPDDGYFEIKSQGYNHELQREEVQIHAGENGNVFLIKTEEGFVVDVYGQEDHHSTLTVWEEDLE